MPTVKGIKNPVLAFEKPKLPSPENVLSKAREETYLERLYVKPLFIEKGTSEMIKRLARDTEAFFRPIPEDTSPEVREKLLKNRAEARELGRQIGEKWGDILFDELQVLLPPGLRKDNWRPSRKARRHWQKWHAAQNIAASV